MSLSEVMLKHLDYGTKRIYLVLVPMKSLFIIKKKKKVAGVQPWLIQGIQRRDGFGDLFIYLFIKDIKSNRMRIAQ